VNILVLKNCFQIQLVPLHTGSPQQQLTKKITGTTPVLETQAEARAAAASPFPAAAPAPAAAAAAAPESRAPNLNHGALRRGSLVPPYGSSTVGLCRLNQVDP
jgi:hypothetical protein